MYKKVNNIPPEALDIIVEQLWKEETCEQQCVTCGTDKGETHLDGCMIAKCTKCGGQAISCGCPDMQYNEWTGYWPGLEYCYANKLICLYTSTGNFIFDLNEGAIKQMRERKEVNNDN